jgi:hypothetical protein
VIVVLGRPGLDARAKLDRQAGKIALAAAAAGGRVEVVGSVGDDGDGDTVVVELGRAGVGHAALLRDPAAATPREGEDQPLPRMDAADIDLGLRYLAECQVLVIADPLDARSLEVASAAARYHGAQLVILDGSGAAAPQTPEAATVLEVPNEDSGAFSELVGRYAVSLDSGRGPAEAWQDAVTETGWQNAPA